MYLGKLVKLTDKKSLYDDPRHPYTRALLSAVPIADPELKRERIPTKGDIPSPINPPSGCRFHTRCPLVEDICRTEEPEWTNIAGDREHFVACHFKDIV